MSYKTDRLIDLFPDVYAARDREALLYKLLDSAGSELMGADQSIKALLKSHWVDYASGAGLDGLGAIFGVARRRLPDGTLETDAAFRLRLKSIVPLFTGGGTRRSVLGAVRSALGFPFDIRQLNLPPQFAALRTDLENLVTLVEFSPAPQRLVSELVDPSPGGELILDVPVVSVRLERPRLEWTFTRGSGRRLEVELLETGQGVRSEDGLVFPQGQTLFLSANSDGKLNAFLGTTDVSARFHALGGGPPVLPEVPRQPSHWRFTSHGPLFDTAVFDEEDAFNLPLFHIQMSWRSYEPLTFDVYVPYFLKAVVNELKRQHNFPGDIFVYEGLDLKTIQVVVDQTRAAGVRGDVHFSLNFRDDHVQQESFWLEGVHHIQVDAGASESLLVSSNTQLVEPHEPDERFAVGGVFNFSRFDSVFAFT
jgi:hypothetical protein